MLSLSEDIQSEVIEAFNSTLLGYNIVVLRQTAFLLFNPIKVGLQTE